jgi:signal transduction histidine kinase
MSLLLFKTVIEYIFDGILILNPNGTLNIANKTFKDYFYRIYFKKLPADFNINNYHEHKLFSSIAKYINSNSQKFISHTIKLEEGLYLNVDCAYIKRDAPFANFGFIVTLRDVSEFVENDNLRKEFVTAVSHELRTPITSINLSIQNLKKYHTQLSDGQRNDLLDMAAESSSLLNQLVEDLLILSRIEARDFELESIEYNLNKIIKNVLKELESCKQVKKISINVDVSSNIILEGDPRRIGQVIQILIDNAIKFSSENSTIKVKASDNYTGKYNIERIDGTLISIKDSGLGIKLLDLPRIFLPFYRAKEVQDTPGTGLNLSIAKRLIDLHQGGIYVESTHGKGSIFRVFLPRKAL